MTPTLIIPDAGVSLETVKLWRAAVLLLAASLHALLTACAYRQEEGDTVYVPTLEGLTVALVVK